MPPLKKGGSVLIDDGLCHAVAARVLLHELPELPEQSESLLRDGIDPSEQVVHGGVIVHSCSIG